MELQATFLPGLEREVEIPRDGIVSRAIYQDAATKVVLFGFDSGQELSEHTASMPAILQLVKGEATWTLGTESQEVAEGAWAYMPAHLPHSIVAKTPVVLLLTLLKSAR